MNNIPIQKIDWTSIEKIEFKGKTGTAIWQGFHWVSPFFVLSSPVGFLFDRVTYCY